MDQTEVTKARPDPSAPEKRSGAPRSGPGGLAAAQAWVAEPLKGAVRMWRHAPGTWLALLMPSVAVVAAATVGLHASGIASASLQAGAAPPTPLDALLQYDLARGGAGVVLATAACWLATLASIAGLYVGFHGALRGGAPAVGTALRQGIARLPAAILVSACLQVLQAAAQLPGLLSAAFFTWRYDLIDALSSTAVGALAVASPLVFFFTPIVGIAAAFVMLRLCLAMPAAVLGGLGVLASLRRSWALTRWHTWSLLGYGLGVAAFWLVVATIAEATHKAGAPVWLTAGVDIVVRAAFTATTTALFVLLWHKFGGTALRRGGSASVRLQRHPMS